MSQAEPVGASIVAEGLRKTFDAGADCRAEHVADADAGGAVGGA